MPVYPAALHSVTFKIDSHDCVSLPKLEKYLILRARNGDEILSDVTEVYLHPDNQAVYFEYLIRDVLTVDFCKVESWLQSLIDDYTEFNREVA